MGVAFRAHRIIFPHFLTTVLEVGPKAEPSAIKRSYYVLARKYHPDKVGKEDKEAAEKFKEIAEAYQVLSDPELRAKYDKEGRGGLSADKTSVAEDMPKLDPTILFSFL
jgi:curved DNA-binding protein CbpA